jgi:excisionase family DNA binding protein
MSIKIQDERGKSNRLTLTEKEFCERVGISRMTAFRMREAGLLPYCRIGTRVLYTEAHIAQFLSNLEHNSRIESQQ